MFACKGYVLSDSGDIVMTVPIPVDVSCSHCGRHLYKSGITLVVEAAVDPDGASVIVQQLRQLSQSPRRAVQQRWEDLNERFVQLAIYGELEIPREMRNIEDELWEIKTSEDRVLFYERVASGHPRSVRLAYLFGKTKGKTPQGKMPAKHIRKGLWIVRGDAAHV